MVFGYGLTISAHPTPDIEIFKKQVFDDEYLIRTAEFSIPVISNLGLAKMLINTLEFYYNTKIDNYVEFAG